jgi:hypothetical protein
VLDKITQCVRTRKVAALCTCAERERLDECVKVLEVLPAVALARAAEARLAPAQSVKGGGGDSGGGEGQGGVREGGVGGGGE